LPFSKEIEWGKYCYQLKEADLLNLPSFINKLSIAEIYQKQRNINQDQHLFEKPYSLKHIINSLESKVNHKSISPAERAIAKMRSPSRMHIICIDVTNKCDLSCSNCTRLLKYQDSLWEMTPDNFRIALKSLTGYTGIIAMIGGNPCTHSKFEQLCQIFEEEIPNRAQRGLWTNNIFKHRIIIEKTFGAFNLNPHNEPRAIDQLTDLYNNMVVKRKFNGALHTGHSHHAPLLTAVKDLYSEELMWQKISCCDVNREWSAAIVQNNGELRAYFCEVAASFDLARAQDNGLPVIPGWWQNPIQTYGTQVKHFCPGCGVPARLKGHNDHEQTDTYTVSNADLAEKANRRKNRNVILLSQDNQNELTHKVTHYSQQAQ
jgi:hypothetical protein